MGTAVKRVRVVMLGVVNIVAGADSQLDDAGEGPCARGCGVASVHRDRQLDPACRSPLVQSVRVGVQRSTSS